MSEDAGPVDYVAGRVDFQGHSPCRASGSEEFFRSLVPGLIMDKIQGLIMDKVPGLIMENTLQKS